VLTGRDRTAAGQCSFQLGPRERPRSALDGASLRRQSRHGGGVCVGPSRQVNSTRSRSVPLAKRKGRPEPPHRRCWVFTPREEQPQYAHANTKVI
jgi:hypothetical protein